MKRTLAWLLAIMMLFGVFAGCSKKQDTQETNQTLTFPTSEDPAANGLNFSKIGGYLANVGAGMTTGSGAQQPNTEVTKSAFPELGGRGVTFDADFVMIYNPLIYDETNERNQVLGVDRVTNQTTGYLGDQILTDIARADDLEFETPLHSLTVGEAERRLNTEMFNLENGRAGGMDPVYSQGDRHTFWIYTDGLRGRKQSEMTCLYKGTYCYIWADKSDLTADEARTFGEAFDKDMYQKDVNAFGQPRFTDNGGKVHVLFYPIDSSGTLGLFSYLDIFATGEATPSQIQSYGLNTDHAIVVANSTYKDKTARLYRTLAHELQHQICATDKFSSVQTPYMRTWLNEGMSAFAEELCFPLEKAKEGYNTLTYLSERYRNGQSVTNFNTDADRYIGAYGTVYLYQEYLRLLSDDNVFSRIHSYWRDAMRANISEATAIYAAIPSDVRGVIDSSVTYPANISRKFSVPEEEWFSKLNLNFWITTAQCGVGHLEGQEQKMQKQMLYAQREGVSIEGGGRIVVATENGKFTVPADASSGLIYVAMDQDFQVKTILDSYGTVLYAGTASGASPTTEDPTVYWNGSVTVRVYWPANARGGYLQQLINDLDLTMQRQGAQPAGIVAYSDMADLKQRLKNDEWTQPGFVLVIPDDGAGNDAELSEILQTYTVRDGSLVFLIDDSLPRENYGFAGCTTYGGSYGTLDAFNRQIGAAYASTIGYVQACCMVDTACGESFHWQMDVPRR